MKVLDASFLIDYLNGVEATKEFYEANDGDAERWVLPVPAYAEALVGAGNVPNGNVEGFRADLAWAAAHAVDEQTAAPAGEIADEVAPEGVFLDGHDALIAAVGRELDAPVVSADIDLTHEETSKSSKSKTTETNPMT
ncbi:Predicted nucleic acid-binding protein, contains PIN domain [Halorientalis persicus]|jgi:predicted nucleic acid-binding protein|uniref:Predicted nucleic acid-binding protein, contains PIN domain n=1 Tax=Halorientalis persicus TaxID=1367881 RepID=A0A1H8WRA8_9EURY|nr:PIN domain-containing protein [Halorientalis persicus]SEP30146.1 Predicted nucleic acid-binding protein, contains PIN domain [Halorientalis persicus]